MYWSFLFSVLWQAYPAGTLALLFVQLIFIMFTPHWWKPVLLTIGLGGDLVPIKAVLNEPCLQFLTPALSTHTANYPGNEMQNKAERDAVPH